MTAPTIPAGWRKLRVGTKPTAGIKIWNPERKCWVAILHALSPVRKGETIIRRIVKRRPACGITGRVLADRIRSRYCEFHCHKYRNCEAWKRATKPKRSCGTCAKNPRRDNKRCLLGWRKRECKHWKRKVKG